MPKLTIDGHEIEVAPGTSVLQAAEQLGIEIPRFCYHERLSVPANCRMCLVEMEKAPKPIASCAMPASDGMVIRTDTETVKKARRGVMEFLLINHPLDCPICDQGGECDLQDQAMAYGFDRSRYTEAKRAVNDKYLGPLIHTIMTRCIHCTRCIRFMDEIAGVPELGAVNRGEHMEVTNFIEKGLNSELSGNIADICPVGALTHKPYAYTARPWELRRVETIDVMDAVGSNIRVDSRGPEVMRVLPRTNDDINEDWLADKSRYSYDGLKRQRLDRPYVRVDGKLRPASWQEAFAAVRARLEGLAPSKIAAVAGDLIDAEAMVALKDLMRALGSANTDCRQDGARFDVSGPAAWRFNTGIARIEQADAILIVGSFPRWEAPLVNARIRKRYLMGGLKVGVIGEPRDLTYPATHLGAGPETLQAVADGSHPFCEVLRNAKNPMLILGMGAVKRPDGLAVHRAAMQVAQTFNMVREDWNGFNLLHTAAARVGGLELGFLPGEGGRDIHGILDGCESGEIEVVYLLGADEIPAERLGKAFVIYQGHHGDRGAHRADVILPGAAYTEKNATWVNLEGRAQQGRMAVFPLGEAREDWKIVRALSEVLGHRLPYDSLQQVRRRLAEVNPLFAKPEAVVEAPWVAVTGASGKMDAAPFKSVIENYYMTDPISRASNTMARCTEELLMGRMPVAELAAE
ncbi:MAG TPA: NADH-quinone oxidoreductase subunit NuoG [Azospirillaceae bacterium]|nr:NADH-quinone oxidoreductase subunit NuoG [Azospirillaceae bacterium]